MVTTCSPRPMRAVQRARLWAITCTASQAPLAAKRPEGRWFSPAPYLRSRMAFLDLGVAAMVGFQFQGLPLPVGDAAVIAVGGKEGQLGTGRGLHPTDDEPHRCGVGLTLEGGVASLRHVGGAVHPVGYGRPVLLGYGLDKIVQAFVLADGDGEADIHLTADGDQGVADALESVLSDNTRRVYGTQWKLFTGWCDEVGLASLPAEPLTVARYLAARAGSGASIATLRLATSAIAKAHEWAKQDSPCRDTGVRASLKGWGRRLAKPQRQAGALTADVLAVIRLTAIQPRRRGRGIETPEQAAERGKVDLALVAALSDAGLRRSEAAALTWGDVQRGDDGSGGLTVIRSKTDVEAQGAVVAITPVAMQALDAIRPVDVGRGYLGCRNRRSPGG